METSLKLVSGAARQAVRSEHADAIRSLRKRAASDIIEIGNRLIDVKENHCAHGEWLPWLEAEFGWSESTALRFMRVAEMAAKSVTVTDLDIPIGSLYQLAAPSTPEPVRQAAFEAIANVIRQLDDVRAKLIRLWLCGRTLANPADVHFGDVAAPGPA
jgi:hypothetical protein